LQVTQETEELRFNTGISALMEFVNAAYKFEEVPKSLLEPFVLLLSPYAPHLGEELWQVNQACFLCICLKCEPCSLSVRAEQGGGSVTRSDLPGLVYPSGGACP
jgi:hypothetical protein